jgi:hypothetical protein
MSVNYYKNGVVKVSDMFNNITNAIDIPIYTLETDNSIWARILHHNNHSGTVLFTSSNVMNIQTDDLYSRLNLLENFRNSDNLFEFMAIQPDISEDTVYRWSQSNNPTNTTSVTDYTNITNGQGGLVKCSGNTLCAVSTSTGNWWCAVGSYSKFSNGIPGFGSKTVTTILDFYVRIDNLSEKRICKIFKNIIVSTDIYET